MEGEALRPGVEAEAGAADSVSALYYLPNLCTTGSVLALVMVTELLALALALADRGLHAFSWEVFGLYSFFMLWVVLSSAGALCLLRERLNALSSAQAFAFCFILILGFTALYTVIVAQLLPHVDRSALIDQLVVNLVISAVLAGIFLRYLYLQHLLQLREQAELSARIQAMQSRIRPHFLFNSLNSIAELIAEQPALAEKLVLDLARVFRASLRLPQLTTLEQELTLCRSFADMEQVRLGPRLRIAWRVGIDAASTQILNFVLQPLVENAIYHGIQPIPEGGEVSIAVEKKASDVVITITNPRLPGSENMASARHGNGIALGNIRNRLLAFYGDRGRMDVTKGEREFCVVLRYPFNEQSVKDQPKLA